MGINEAKTLFQEADTDGTGYLDLEKFENHLSDIRVQALLRKLGVEFGEADTAKGLFTLLDFNQNGNVDLEEFTMGLELIHGQAKCIDIAKIRKELMDMHRHLHEDVKSVAKQLRELKSAVRHLTSGK